jgi:transcriptional regulator with XRE-family HTH domain
MSGEALRKVRESRGLTQAEAGARLGVSQGYVALLEKGRRPMPPKLVRKAVRLFKLSPVFLPPTGKNPFAVTVNELTRDLSRLKYPGFAYLRGGWMKNPGEVLLAALARPDLDSRVAEALPWLLLNYPDLESDWLVKQARLLNLTNRLGFVVDLARLVDERNNRTDSSRYRALSRLADSLRLSRLDVEDTLGQESLTNTERNWLRANRSQEAQFWHLLSDWRPEFLQFVE